MFFIERPGQQLAIFLVVTQDFFPRSHNVMSDGQVISALKRFLRHRGFFRVRDKTLS
jgi:hypothetical protein